MLASKPPLDVEPLLIPLDPLAPLLDVAPSFVPMTLLPLLLVDDAFRSPSSLSLAHPPTITRVTRRLSPPVARNDSARGWRRRLMASRILPAERGRRCFLLGMCGSSWARRRR